MVFDVQVQYTYEMISEKKRTYVREKVILIWKVTWKVLMLLLFEKLSVV